DNNGRPWENDLRVDLRLVCAPIAGVPVAQRKPFSSDEQSRYTKYYRPAPLGTKRPSVGGDLRWPNGSWPGEKTPYFPAKTGHMARHGIWPSDRLCLRWAGWVKPCHGLVRCA